METRKRQNGFLKIQHGLFLVIQIATIYYIKCNNIMQLFRTTDDVSDIIAVCTIFSSDSQVYFNKYAFVEINKNLRVYQLWR